MSMCRPGLSSFALAIENLSLKVQVVGVVALLVEQVEAQQEVAGEAEEQAGLSCLVNLVGLEEVGVVVVVVKL